MNHVIRLIARVGQFVELAILVCVRLGITDHAADFLIRQPAGRLDNNILFLAGTLVLGRHIENTVGIDIKGDLDLRNTARSRWNIGQVKTAQ